MYSAAALSRHFVVLSALLAACCAGVKPPARPPLFPLAPVWKTLLGEFVTSPLAADGRRVYVASGDGIVRALDQATGEVLWRAEGMPGRLAASDGVLLVRDPEGGLVSLQPRTGGVRWRMATAVAGDLPATIDEDRALVAGKGLAAVELASGRLLWSQRSPVELTAPPVRAGARLLMGEADGTLRCRDRATGLSLWTLHTERALLAPPLVDWARRRAYLGTTDKRILEVHLDDGKTGWRWRVGADIADPGLLTSDQVLFAAYDAVLYSLRRGGNLAWRAGLPSRPLSAPLPVPGYVLLACLEDQLVAFVPATGGRAGSFQTTAEIRTPPLVVGSLVVVGLRDRSVVAYSLPSAAGATPSPPPAVEPPPANR